MTRMRNYLQHRLNPAHMYCRLMDFGVGRNKALKMCAMYERFIYRGLLWNV